LDPPGPSVDLALLKSELDALVLRRAVAGERLAYLEALRDQLRGMAEAGRRVLPRIGEPRTALREHAAAVASLAEALSGLAERLEELRVRVESGALVGFRAEARERDAELSRLGATLLDRSAQMEEVAAAHYRLADGFESEARGLRRQFFTSVLDPERVQRMDPLFLRHLEEQRRLQRSAGRGQGSADRAGVQQLAERARGTAGRPAGIGSVSEAGEITESVVTLLARVDEVLEASADGLDAWRLAFENEMVTFLSGQISAATREEAYALSSSLLRDVRAEAGLAAQRMAAWWEDVRSELGTPGRWLTSRSGRERVIRGLGLFAVVAAWLLARRSSSGIVVASVRILARSRIGTRVRLGTIVRWSGLLQSLAPTLLAYPAILAAIALVGPASAAAALLRAVGIPLVVYVLGRQLLLGTTRRITPGRPALVELPASVVPRLWRTYARLGLVIAGAVILHGIAEVLIGAGVIVTAVDAFAVTWVGVWATWEAVAWRSTLAEAWRREADSEPPGLEARVADWMGRSRLGALLSPPAALRIVLGRLVATGIAFGRHTNLGELMQARRLGRVARGEEHSGAASPLPDDYLREFPLNPVLESDDALMLPRKEMVAPVLDQITQWKESRAEGSLVVIGEKGSGKTTLGALVARQATGVEVVEHTLRGKPSTADELFRQLSPKRPVNGATELSEWIEGLCAGPERIVILDEAHNVFLRVVDGYRGYDALIDLVNSTSDRIFWVLIFNTFTWRFLHASRSRNHYFRRLLEAQAWSTDEIRDLIARRNRRTGFDLEFDEMLLSGDRTAAGRLELVEGADGFFRLLRDTSGGNPRVATRLWLAALRPVAEKRLRVGAFREPDGAALEGLSDELLFALAAITQHENLSADELCRVLNVPDGFARFAFTFLLEAELVVPKDGHPNRVTPSAPYYRQILRTLRRRHLLFE
jgi:hypothetical protein